MEYRVFPGQCLSIVGYHLPRPEAFSLRDMLLQTASWSPRPAFPQYAPGPCYCCATERGHLLFTVDQSAPWALRPDLAAACGFDASAMHLSPAQPRVLDCAVYGHVCRTVLAVGRRPPNSEGGCTWAIVVDCRPILQGWHYVATAGVVDFDRLEVELGELAPPFWELFIVNRPAGAGHHSVCDGQVFVAEFRARRQEFYPEGDIFDEVSASQDSSSGSPRSPARQDVAQHPDGTASRPGQLPETSGDDRPIEACVASSAPVNMCRPGILPDVALCSGARCFTPVYRLRLPPGRRHMLALLVVSLCLQPVTAGCDHTSVEGWPAIIPDSFVGPSARRVACGPATLPGAGSDAAFRPLPTPCRAPFPPDMPASFAADVPPEAVYPSQPALSGCSGLGSDGTPLPSDDLGLADLTTLLWERARDPSCLAFLQASTILETCFEFFGPHVSRFSPRRTLALAMLVPSTTAFCPFWAQLGSELLPDHWCRKDLPGLHNKRGHEPLTIGPYTAPCNVSQLLQLLMPVALPGDGWAIICALRQQDVAKLRGLCFSPADFVSDCLHCFTDGSFCATAPSPADTCAWACFFVCPCSGRCAAISGKVPSWAFEVDRPSAFVAECYALLVAAWLSVTRFFRLQVDLLSDCRDIAAILAMRWPTD